MTQSELPEGFEQLVQVCAQAKGTQQAIDIGLAEDEAAELRRTLTHQLSEASRYANVLAKGSGHTAWELLARARMQAEASAKQRRPLPQSPHCALCPVKGCGAELPIDPKLADRPYICPCPKQQVLHVGRTADKEWTLLPPIDEQQRRATINRIAHALFVGQGYKQDSRPLTQYRAPDANSARMGEAFLGAHGLAMQCVQAVLDGHPQWAYDLAVRANASATAFKLHERAYERRRREHQRTGLWHDAEVFWIEQPNPAEADMPTRRFHFTLIGLWNEEKAAVEVLNGDQLARDAGMRLPADAWSQLVALLSRLETKPGRKTDPEALIYQLRSGSLTLRPHVKRNYASAELALEALRRTLSLERGDAVGVVRY